MITKQTTKRAAKILAEQKREYEKKFQSAKGDSKAIARAAAEYRSEYGKTPLKRWHNALSQAAKETSSHVAPLRKPAKPAAKPKSAAPDKTPKYRVPCYVILTHFWKSLPFEKQAPYVVCFNEYEVKDGKIIYKAVTTHPNGGKVVQQSIEERKLSDSLVANERIMISSFENVQREIAYNKYQKDIKAAEKKKHDAEVAKRKAAKTVAKAKVVKMKPEYKVGTYFKSPKDGSIYRVSWVEVVAGANPHVKYQLLEPRGQNREANLDEKSIKKWIRVSSKEAAKYWKRYTDEQRRREQFEQRVKEAEEAKKRKEQFKALIKKNPDWIKNFAKQTGLTTAAIEALYHICTTDDLRPVMCGIYCSEHGDLVATDAHSLATIRVKSIPAAWKGKIFAPSGKTIEGRYPNFEAVLVQKGKVKVLVGHAHIERFYKEIPNKPSAEFKNSYGDLCVDLGSVRLKSQKYKRMMKLFEAMKETPQVLQTGEETTATGFEGKYVRAVMMPVLKNEY